ncbi:atlastin-like isoform X2 [Trichogramma pretiosum]|uniref:atlastin-like isoform X2 n=1 Tax=Trichogramma pretiosum TaxID=7493 RepID=UPI0006C953F2|nr:atlastin-like isoform X2 [Trichogramma pretiosum]
MGHPIEIVKTSPDHSFVFDEASLTRLLNQDDLKDRRLIIVSMAGPFDRSKDLLLNFFLRYVNCQYKLKNGSEEWMGDEMQPLEGVSWQNNDKKIGIQIWSEVFKTELPNGEKIAIVLMNSQGFFGCHSITDHQSASVFALTTKLSSMQLFFLPECIRKKNLQQLHFIMEYVELAENQFRDTFGQRLKFLVRDWPYPHEYKYGAEGGRDYLLHTFGYSNIQDQELICLKEKLDSYFSEYSCFLMPHSGYQIAQNIKLNGLLSEIRNDCKQVIKNLVPKLLAPENLDINKIGPSIVTASSLLEHFKNGIHFYRNLDLLKIRNILAIKYNLPAMLNAVDMYEASMNTFCGPNLPYLKNERFQLAHDVCYNQAIQYFEKEKKLGYDDESDRMLKEAIDEKFEAFNDSNQDKFCERILCDKSVILIVLSIILCIIFFIVRAQEKVDSDDTSQFPLVNFKYKKYPSFKSIS